MSQDRLTRSQPSTLLQKKTRDPAASVHDAAAHGISGGGSALPHAEAIQRSFGRHAVGGIVAHTDSAATEATQAMGAAGYATGHHVAFRGAPDLHTAAHEAAHVVQQQKGVSLAGGVGRVGDPYERHADAVADLVVQGKSAESLLDTMAPTPGNVQMRAAVQRDGEEQVANAANVSAADAPVNEGSHTAHMVGQGAEVASHVMDAVELFHLVGEASFAVGIVGVALGGIATFAAVAAQLHAGDEFRDALVRVQPFIISLCNGFAHGVRGEGGGGGQGAAQGAAAGARARAAVLGRPGANPAMLATMDLQRLYSIAFNQVRQPIINRLISMQRSGLFGTHFMESDAVPNAPAIAAAVVDDCRERAR